MGRRKKLEKQIGEVKLALRLSQEDKTYYENMLGGSDGLEKWTNYRLEELKKYLTELRKL